MNRLFLCGGVEPLAPPTDESPPSPVRNQRVFWAGPGRLGLGPGPDFRTRNRRTIGDGSSSIGYSNKDCESPRHELLGRMTQLTDR